MFYYLANSAPLPGGPGMNGVEMCGESVVDYFIDIGGLKVRTLGTIGRHHGKDPFTIRQRTLDP